MDAKLSKTFVQRKTTSSNYRFSDLARKSSINANVVISVENNLEGIRAFGERVFDLKDAH